LTPGLLSGRRKARLIQQR
jgi:cbb3-type cytochrome oxidase subunit 1